MDHTENERPKKKPRTGDIEDDSKSHRKSNQPRKWQDQRKVFKRQQRKAELDHPQPESPEHRRDRELFGINDSNEAALSLKPLKDEKREELHKLHVPKMFSQPSVMATADKGIYVTCDKGKEKKCLTELADLVESYLEDKGLIPAELLDPDALLESRLERQQKKNATVKVDNEESPVEEEEVDIESSINAELAKDRHLSANAKPFQLITLDIPCVSFLRFNPGGFVFDKIDVVDLVHTICAQAASNPGQMRSRFIKRLSPVSWLGKVLSSGLERACEEVLPTVFKVDDTHDAVQKESMGLTFAIRPTIRNNDKVSRDDVIKKVADEVQSMGANKHKVDLKGYQKGILVEVYRSWIGMSVVDNSHSRVETESGEQNKLDNKLGYEALRRFNLSEIYADGLKDNTKET